MRHNLVGGIFTSDLLSQAYVGEHILQQRPHSVVVETAITPVHGAASGNVFTCSSAPPIGGNFFARLFCHAASQLADEPDPQISQLWQVYHSGLMP